MRTADVFVACWGSDENNIMAAVEARDLGASQIMAVVGRPDYAQVIGKLGIDQAVSEREVFAKQVLSFLNEGVIVSRTKLPGGEIHLIELEAAVDSRATQSTLAKLGLPERCLVVAIIRRDFVWVPGATDQIQGDDKVILLVDDDMVDQTVGFFVAPKS